MLNPLEENIINRVANSGLVEIDMEEYYPRGERVVFDMKERLFRELVLREKEFREFVKTNNWLEYRDKFAAIHCSADAIIPTWAYMLVAAALQPWAKDYVFGDLKVLETLLFQKSLSELDPEKFRDKKVVVKGCGKIPVPESAYVELARILTPVVQSLMFGEPCSTVPVYKRK